MVSKKALIGILIVIIIIIGGVAYYLTYVPPPKNKIVVGTTDKITTLDPANAYDYLSCNVIMNVFDGLVRYKLGTTELEPGLAASWEISENGTVYTFHLREGVKFHDGSEFNATVVKWSIERVINLKGDPAFLLADIVDKVEVVDRYTVKITLKYPFSAFLSIMAFTVSFPVSMKSFPENEFSDVAIGTGPFKVKEFKRDEYLILERNEEYWDPARKPKVKYVVIKFYASATALKQALEAGEIDIAYRTLLPIDIQSYIETNGTNFYILESVSPFIRYIVINTQTVPKEVRQAIANAINRTEIVETVFLGQAIPLYSMVPIGMWSHIDAFEEKWGVGPNVTRVQELMAKLGYNETNKYKLDLWYTPTHYGDTEDDIAVLLEHQLEATGVFDVTLKYAEWSTYVDQIEKGVMPVFLLGWYPDYLDPDDYLYPFLYSAASPYLGAFYNNSEVDQLLEQARMSTDIDERTDLYEQVQMILAEDCPYIPMFQGKQYVVFKKGVGGVMLDPTQNFYYFTLYWKTTGGTMAILTLLIDTAKMFILKEQ